MTIPSRLDRNGEVIGGRYRIGRFLAQGGMGAVYEAQHTVVRRRFAVKFLHASFTANREILTRFQREAEAAGALQSENVAAVLDFGVAADGSPYMVMEYLAGESLADLIGRAGRLPVGRAADLCLQACHGTEAAHAAGIVHRDLKPANLFVCRRPDGADLIKVLDFGVAKLRGSDGNSSATGAGVLLGTPLYMSPEQARGDQAIDQRTDVYALGAILYEMLSGRRPHPGDSHNAVLFHVSTQPAVPLASVRSGLPEALVELVERALASDPAARPASVRVLAQALAPLAERKVYPESGAGEPSRGDPGAPTALSPERPLQASSSSQGPSLPAPVSAGRRSRRLVGAVAATAAVSLAVFLGVHRNPRTTARWPSPPLLRVAATDPVARAPLSVPPSPRTRALTQGTALFAPAPPAAARQQIADLRKARAHEDAALLGAMLANPSAIWFAGGSPQEVQTEAHNTVIQATRRQQVPVMVAFNHPFLDCSGYGGSGATDNPHYQAWIEAFANGIGNERAVVILEPSSLGHIPYNARLDGTADTCRPMVTDPQGALVRAPGADPASRYAVLNNAITALAARAPNAMIYLDGANANWLPAGEIAHRLIEAGVVRTRGFFINTGNDQSTARSIEYGQRISACIQAVGGGGGGPPDRARFNDCDAPSFGAPAVAPATLHFVIDTAHNGQKPLNAALYAAEPYRQPPAVVATLQAGGWCSPPGAGVGLRPTTDTGIDLVDAYLWIDYPGRSPASCDVEGGARAWDYSRYNPWGIAGDALKHFDPLWGMVDPAEGEWFPEQALALARRARPPLLERRAIGRLSTSPHGSTGPDPGLGVRRAPPLEPAPFDDQNPYLSASTRRAASP